MDRLDRELVRSAYHDDAIDDHAAFVGPVERFLDWAFNEGAGEGGVVVVGQLAGSAAVWPAPGLLIQRWDLVWRS
jgi:hypothetical protein